MLRIVFIFCLIQNAPFDFYLLIISADCFICLLHYTLHEAVRMIPTCLVGLWILVVIVILWIIWMLQICWNYWIQYSRRVIIRVNWRNGNAVSRGSCSWNTDWISQWNQISCTCYLSSPKIEITKFPKSRSNMSCGLGNQITSAAGRMIIFFFLIELLSEKVGCGGCGWI